jgi:hypothetical protein
VTAAPAGAPGPSVADAEVDSLLAVVQQQADGIGRVDLARTIDAERRRRTLGDPALIVFAGEPNQGKSRLINSLLDRPDLLPVDGDVSTGVHVVMQDGAPEALRVFIESSETPVPAQPDEIASYVSVRDNPANVKGVRRVELDVRSDLLARGIRLVDTPGVGGLDAAHGRFTLAALSEADALVFVADAGGPISQPELEFLAKASDRIDSILLVLTKIDNHPGWRDVLEENRVLLRAQAARLADAQFIPVSAKLAAAAQGAPQGPMRDRMRLESRLGDLESWLVDGVAVGRREARTRNALRLGCSAADTLLAVYDDTIAAMSSPAGLASQLSQRQAELDRLKRAADGWRSRLSDDLSSVERRAVSQLGTGASAVTRRVEQRIARQWNAAIREGLAHELELELTALELDIQQSLAGSFRDTMRAAGARLEISEVELPPVQFDSVGALAAQLEYQSTVIGDDAGRAFRTVLTTGTALLTGGPMAIVRVLIALTTIGLDWGGARRTRDQTEARSFVSSAVGAWQSEANLLLLETVRGGRNLIEELLGAAVEQRIATKTQEIDELTRLSSSQQQQDQRRQQIEGFRTELREVRPKLDALLARPAAAAAATSAAAAPAAPGA